MDLMNLPAGASVPSLLIQEHGGGEGREMGLVDIGSVVAGQGQGIEVEASINEVLASAEGAGVRN